MLSNVSGIKTGMQRPEPLSGSRTGGRWKERWGWSRKSSHLGRDWELLREQNGI